MVFCRVMLAGIVCPVSCATTPQIQELALGVATLEPVEALVHRFGSFGSHGAHGETLGRDVVRCDHGAIMLRMAHFSQCGANGNGVFAAIIQGGEFRFGGGRHHVFDY